MKTNLLKYGKKALTVVLAIAVLAVSLFSAVGSIVSAAVWDGSAATAYASGTGTKADPFIIENAEQLYKMVKEYGKDASGNAAYFKVADDVDAISVNDATGFDVANPDITGWNNWLTGLDYNSGSDQNDKTFVGNFDGNGATIYGLYAYSDSFLPVGFVPGYGAGAVVKNVAFKMAYVRNEENWARAGAGVVAGYGYGNGSTATSTLEISNVSITNCYVYSAGSAGALVGNTHNNSVTINTCLVADNNITGVVNTGGLVGNAWGASSASNTIVIGIQPESTGGPYNIACTNVYTDTAFDRRASGVTKIADAAAAKGAAAATNMPGLTWGVGGWEAGAEGEYPVFSTAELSNDFWNGIAAESYASGTGAEEDPFIIENADQLFKMVKEYGKDSSGNAAYFKVADDVDVIDINDISDFDFSNPDFTNLNNWMTGLDYDIGAANTGKSFAGKFDGNGATISGLYAYSASFNSVGFIPSAADGAEIKNVYFESAYVANAQDSGREGVAVVIGRFNENITGEVKISKVSVQNCYVSSVRNAGGIVGATRGNSIAIDTCLVADNQITGNTASGGLIGDASWCVSTSATNTIVIGIQPESTSGPYNITCDAIYTDIAYDRRASGVTKIADAAAAKGAAAKTNMPSLTWGAGGWEAGAEGEYPVFSTAELSNDFWNGFAAKEYASGTGIEADPFIIENADQLFKMVKEYGKDSSGNAAYFKVADDVDVININDISDFDFSNPDFTDLNNWMTGLSYDIGGDNNGKSFVGKFDGNGVTIRGLYAYSASFNSVGFIPAAATGAEVKNVSFESAYVANAQASGREGVAVVIGRRPENDPGDVNISKVSVQNCYVSSGQNAGGLVGATRGNNVVIDTCFVADNIITGATSSGGLVGDAWGESSATNTIVIGIKPESTTQYRGVICTNVYTDTDAADPDKRAPGVIKIENADVAKGAAAATNMPDLIWGEGGWIPTTDSYPEIIAFHTIGYVADGDNGHKISCTDTDCNANLVASTIPHGYNESYYCEACDYQHTHNMVDAATGAPVDCTTDGEVATKCDKDCGYTSTRVVEATGHVFGEVQEATDGDCCHSGTVAYKVCEVCEGKFAEDADVMSTDVLETIETGVMGAHNWVAQDALLSACEEVEDIAYDKCDICGKYQVGEDIQDEAPTIAGHTFGEVHEAAAGDCCNLSTVAYKECEACGLKFAADAEETATEALETIYGEYGAHNWIPQTPIAAGCAGGQPITYDKCDICNKYLVGGLVQDEIPVAEGHTFGEVNSATDGDCKTLGTVAYKACLACGKNFAPDADVNATVELETIYTGYGEHNWVAQDPLTSECEKIDAIAYDKCDICNKYRVGEDISEIKPEIAGHNCTWKYVESVCAAVYGIDYSECEACGKLFDVEGNEIEEVPEAPGHTYSFINYDETHHWYECACGEYEDKYEHEGDPCGCGYVPAPTVVEGWKSDANGWWYQYADGSYPASAWLSDGGVWYYFNASGYMVTGWQSVGGVWYYFNASGAMATGWVFDGAWYYMNASGAMVTGWVYDGAWYYMNASGAMVTGWQVIGGAWYYFYDSGAMAANCWVGNYWVDANGVWVA